jgi:hypothetical protein
MRRKYLATYRSSLPELHSSCTITDLSSFVVRATKIGEHTERSHIQQRCTELNGYMSDIVTISHSAHGTVW